MKVGTRVRVCREDTIFAGATGTVTIGLVGMVRDYFEVELDEYGSRYYFDAWELEEI